jgi:hypothetical protein
MGRWTDKDTADYSGDSGQQVSEASHQARDDATASGDFERGNDKKNSERFSRDSDAGKAAGGFWSSIFG